MLAGAGARERRARFAYNCSIVNSCLSCLCRLRCPQPAVRPASQPAAMLPLPLHYAAQRLRLRRFTTADVNQLHFAYETKALPKAALYAKAAAASSQQQQQRREQQRAKGAQRVRERVSEEERGVRAKASLAHGQGQRVAPSTARCACAPVCVCVYVCLCGCVCVWARVVQSFCQKKKLFVLFSHLKICLPIMNPSLHKAKKKVGGIEITN